MIRINSIFSEGSSFSLKSLLCACLIFISSFGKSQRYIEPSLGYSFDLNNRSFRQLALAVQTAKQTGTNTEFILRLQVGLPLPATSSAPAFTSNPVLPLSIMASKKISPFSIAFLPGWRLQLGRSKGNNRFYAVPMVGLKFERIGVRYAYDKGNYTILNPDKSLPKFGATAGLSIEYMHLLKKGRIITAIQAVAPTVGTESKYPSSFRFTFPLSLQVGYSFPLSKH